VTEFEHHRQLVRSLSDDLRGPDTESTSRLVISSRTDESVAAFDVKVSTVVSAGLSTAFYNKFIYNVIFPSLCFYGLIYMYMLHVLLLLTVYILKFYLSIRDFL